MAVDLWAYSDESGTHGRPLRCVISGHIASPRQWKLFEADWTKVLDKHNVPDFHAKDFFSAKARKQPTSPYFGWLNDELSAFVTELANVIHRRRLNPIGGAVDVPAFMSFTKGQRRYLTGGEFRAGKWIRSGAPSRPYQLAFQTLLTEACAAAKEGVKVQFIFDRNHVEAPLAVQTFNAIAEGLRHPTWEKLGEIRFANRTEHIGLQSADLHTHVWYALVTALAESATITDERFTALEILTKKRARMGIWTKELMDSLLDKAPTEHQAAFKAEL